MNKKFWLIFSALTVIETIIVGSLLLKDANFQLLSSQGSIALQQRNLILLIVAIMLILAVPLLSVLYFIAFRYRKSNSGNRKPKNIKQGGLGEIVWWIIPSFFILILAFITWNKTHALDPYKPLASDVEPVTVQVVALNWKWLFLYPQFGVATVNYLQIPVDTPVNFELTADGPMNSFWIPQLSGQIYSMTGMSTKLHLDANTPGIYRGQAAEINGHGYSGMTFKVRVTTESEFESWISKIKNGSKGLDLREYNTLSQPSQNIPPMEYSSYDNKLYEKIMSKFMPEENGHTESGGSTHE